MKTHLVFDVGNSNIVVGFFEAAKASYHPKAFFKMSTPPDMTTDEFSVQFFNLLKFHRLDQQHIEKAMFSSVVPSLNHNITKMMNLHFDLDITQASKDYLNGWKLHYDKPGDLGMDRLINLKAAATLFGMPTIVIDYGTAITIDALNQGHEFLGGLIIPGVGISLEALVHRTSKLPRIELSQPQDILGRSTKACMQSGVYHLNCMGVDSIVKKILESHFPSQKVHVIATGGLSSFMAKHSPYIQAIEPNLSLIGLKVLLDQI